MDVTKWYIKNRPIYKRLAEKVESLLSEVFEMQNISYHIITSRVKELESVKGKISKGKYDNPQEQIQDYAGIRIITYVEDEVAKVCKVIEDIFDIDTGNSTNKSEELGIDKVGYKSIHFIASLDKLRLELPENKQYTGKYFEIQVRTILQHAWAEIEHDRNYKFTGKLPPEIGRRFKILSGVLEMADREFNNISNEIDLIAKNTSENTAKGFLNIPISSTTLNQFLLTRFKELFEGKGNLLIPSTDAEIITELEMFGLNTLEDINKLITDKFENAIKILSDKQRQIYETGLIRRILIVTDPDKYFNEVLQLEHSPELWIWSNHENYDQEYEFFMNCGIDWHELEKKYSVKLTDY
ncbi:GTP pyrophosphokinase [Sulfurovum mangrovi]|uniref:GTP pyrophosphokinase n=1 Tax=Sulfurovum mangrovi TaxID=2893889 RepID=UPI001E562AC0|nr:hypothetical protein [Sulfurovum mangrovi]UFH60034.1 hypothetical protein LN246_04100 [Sulfurovum mangrovi]